MARWGLLLVRMDSMRTQGMRTAGHQLLYGLQHTRRPGSFMKMTYHHTPSRKQPVDIPGKAPSYKLGILPRRKIKVKMRNSPPWENLPPLLENINYCCFAAVLLSQWKCGDSGKRGLGAGSSMVVPSDPHPSRWL